MPKTNESKLETSIGAKWGGKARAKCPNEQISDKDETKLINGHHLHP